ncbi:MAG: hypothetical protein IJX87_04965 [Clostridia bacterium]|nr:hypothetical protein [Clostridia bacterium]
MDELRETDIQEKEQEYDFSSVAVMGEEEYQEFNSVSYSQSSTLVLVLLIFFAVCTIPQQFLFPQNRFSMLICTGWVLLVFVLLFFYYTKERKGFV